MLFKFLFDMVVSYFKRHIMSIQKIIQSRFARVAAVVIVIVIAAVVIRARGAQSPRYEIVSAQKSDIAQIVAITGRVASSQEFDAAFEVSGIVHSITVTVGDHVIEAQELARLDSQDVEAQVRQKEAQLLQSTSARNQSEAAIEKEYAELAKLLEGVTVEERSLADAKVTQASQSWNGAQKQKEDALRRAKSNEDQAQTKVDNATANRASVANKAIADLESDYASAFDALMSSQAQLDDAVSAKVDDLFIDDQTASPKLSFTTTDIQQKFTVETERVLVGKALDAMHSLLAGLEKDHANVAMALNQVGEYAEIIRTFLIHLNKAIDNAAAPSSTTLAGYKTNLASARANVNTASASLAARKQDIAVQEATNNSAITAADAEFYSVKTAQAVTISENTNALVNSEVKVNDAREALQRTREERRVAVAPARGEDIQAHRARVREAEARQAELDARIIEMRANRDEAVSRLNKTILRSPISGVVGTVNGKRGVLAKIGSAFIRIIADPPYTIESFVPEVDSAKVTLHNKAKITLDSYGSEVIFDGEVVVVDLAETIVDSVPTYKTTVRFASDDPRIRPGMTANIDVETARAPHVVAIPERAIIRKDGKKFVRVVVKEDSGKERIVETMIEAGLRGSGGLVEVTRGLRQGERIVLFMEK